MRSRCWSAWTPWAASSPSVPCAPDSGATLGELASTPDGADPFLEPVLATTGSRVFLDAPAAELQLGESMWLPVCVEAARGDGSGLGELRASTASKVRVAEGPWCSQAGDEVVLAFNVDQPLVALRRGDVVGTIVPQSARAGAEAAERPTHAHVIVDDQGLEKMMETELPP